jgi:hypothetical protein
MLAPMNARAHHAVLLALALVACGGGEKKPAEDASDAAESEPSSAEDDGPGAAEPDEKSDGGGSAAAEEPGVPQKCASQEDDMCLPSKSFVKKMCNGDYPTVAMMLFADGTPWKRGYLTHETNAWNASGGGSSNEKLALDEEVLVLRFRKPSSSEDGIQVSGASGGFDALRWDGMCVTLDASELRFDPPSKPRNARLIWSRIEVGTRDALKKDETVRKAYLAYRKECKGVTVGTVSKACEKLDGELSGIIANYVRESGSTLPPPKKLPE